MTTVGFIDDAVLFSPDMPQAVNALLQRAVVVSRNDKVYAEQLFKQAHELDTACLQTYFALYKFNFYQARLDEAESFVLAGLAEASRQGGFPADYRHLFEEREQWNLYADEVCLFYLYTLKALAFIKLRQQQTTHGCNILSIIQVLDPEDRSGASVIMALAEALLEETS